MINVNSPAFTGTVIYPSGKKVQTSDAEDKRFLSSIINDLNEIERNDIKCSNTNLNYHRKGEFKCKNSENECTLVGGGLSFNVNKEDMTLTIEKLMPAGSSQSAPKAIFVLSESSFGLIYKLFDMCNSSERNDSNKSGLNLLG